jgi:hypothetical protein
MKGTSQFPTLLESFFMDRLMRQPQASPPTVASYRDTFRLLMRYAKQRLRKAPSQLTVPDLDKSRSITAITSGIFGFVCLPVAALTAVRQRHLQQA